MNNSKELKEYLNNFDRITIVTGAGISTLSGIPDYSTMEGRIVEGIYYSPREIFSLNFIQRFYNEYWEWHKEHFAKQFHENKIHDWISELIKSYSEKEINLITQNVDGLQTKSFNKHNLDNKIIEFHGNLQNLECLNCFNSINLEALTCLNCGSRKVKPSIVFYGQNIKKENLIKAETYLRRADLILVLGTSLQVEPLSSLVLFNGDEKVLWIDKNKNRIVEENNYVEFVKADFNKFFE